MVMPPRLDNYPTEPSRLIYYKRRRTPIGSELWFRHMDTLRKLEAQATKLGLFEIAYELALCVSEHMAEQLRAELEDDHGLLK